MAGFPALCFSVTALSLLSGWALGQGRGNCETVLKRGRTNSNVLVWFEANGKEGQVMVSILYENHMQVIVVIIKEWNDNNNKKITHFWCPQDATTCAVRNAMLIIIVLATTTATKSFHYYMCDKQLILLEFSLKRGSSTCQSQPKGAMLASACPCRYLFGEGQ